TKAVDHLFAADPGRPPHGRARTTAIGSETDEKYPVLIRQKESDLLTKLANMLRAEERRPKGARDDELIATINRTMEDLKRQSKQRGQRGRDSPAEVRAPKRPDPPSLRATGGG